MPKSTKTAKKIAPKKALKKTSFIDTHFWIITAVGLIFILMCLMVIEKIEWKKKMMRKQSEAVVQQNVPVISYVPEKFKVEVQEGSKKGWKKYIYAKVGFSLELPAELSAKVDDDLMNFNEAEDFYLEISKSDLQTENSESMPLIKISVFPENMKSGDRKEVFEKKNLLAGQTGIFSEACNEHQCMQEYDLIVNQKNYLVNVYPHNGAEALQKQILSTFMFLK